MGLGGALQPGNSISVEAWIYLDTDSTASLCAGRSALGWQFRDGC